MFCMNKKHVFLQSHCDFLPNHLMLKKNNAFVYGFYERKNIDIQEVGVL